MTNPPTRWALCRARNTAPAARMYCFPHSGGSPGEYLRWSSRLPDWEVWAMLLPGRGSRIEETAFTDMTTLIDAIVTQASFEPPFVFFGHSLGALVAYETAAALAERGAAGPEALVLSASPAPHLVKACRSLHGLDGAELVAAIEQVYGPVPAEMHTDAELRNLLLTGLRADLEIVSGYTRQRRRPLTIPMTVFGGKADDEDPVELSAWSEYTTGAFSLRMFDGDHFYFREHCDDFFPALADTVGEPTSQPLPR